MWASLSGEKLQNLFFSHTSQRAGIPSVEMIRLSHSYQPLLLRKRLILSLRLPGQQKVSRKKSFGWQCIWGRDLVNQSNTVWGDESWTAFCSPVAAAVGGLCAERLVKPARWPSKQHYTYGGSGGQQWAGWAALNYNVISLDTNSSLRALHGTDLLRRTVWAPAPVGALFSRWKSS